MKPVVFVEGIASLLKTQGIDSYVVKQIVQSSHGPSSSTPNLLMLTREAIRKIGTRTLRITYREDENSFRVLAARWDKK